MAKMTLADLVSHQEFMEYFNLRMVETSPLIRSGIVSQDPAIAAKCANAGFEGKTVDMPFLNSLDEADDAEVPVEDTAPVNTDKVKAGQDTAVVQFRRKKFGITDVTRILGGVDPARQIIDFAQNMLQRFSWSTQTIRQKTLPASAVSRIPQHTSVPSSLPSASRPRTI